MNASFLRTSGPALLPLAEELALGLQPVISRVAGDAVLLAVLGEEVCAERDLLVAGVA